MTEFVKETVVTQQENISPAIVQTTSDDATSLQTVEYLIYFGVGIMEVMLLFRLVFRLLGAGASGAFVGLLYTVTNILILPFGGIFRSGFSQGVETTSVFEPATLIAMAVYVFVSWGIVKLVRISSGERQETD